MTIDNSSTSYANQKTMQVFLTNDFVLPDSW